MDFLGLITHVSPHDLPTGGMQVQESIQVSTPRRLDVRKGNRPVTFANAISASTEDVVAMGQLRRAEAVHVIYQLADGTVKAGRSPT